MLEIWLLKTITYFFVRFDAFLLALWFAVSCYSRMKVVYPGFI